MQRLWSPLGPASRPGSRSAMPAWGFAAAGGTAVTLYGAGPSVLALPLFLLIAVSSIAAAAVAAYRHPDRSMWRPWWAVVVALTCFFGASIVRLTVPGADPMDPPSLASFAPDVLVVPGYLAMAYTLWSMLGTRRAADDDPARADALLVGLGAAFATWVFLIGPRFAGHPPSPAVLGVALFPMADVVLLVMVSRLLLADGVRKASLWLLGIATSGIFVGDLFYSIQVDGLSSSGDSLMVVDLAFLIAYVAVGAAVLHPTMRTLTEPQRVVVRRLGPFRVAVIAALLLAPTALATLAPAAGVWNNLIRLTISTLLTVTIIVRIVSSNNRRSRAEQVARRAEHAERHRATHDALTDLPNRELLAETITRWSAEPADGHEISLLCLDLDRFKTVNDTWGHHVGDELLRAVAARLAGTVRGTDMLARIGGDEFVIALRSPVRDDFAEALARRLIAGFADPFPLSVGNIVISPSVGVARSAGDTVALELIRDADTAMYQAKDSGRNRYASFDASLREKAQTRAGLEQALRGALERGELEVHYQPIVDLPTGELAGFEALMRWHHPDLGSVSPVDFIPIAEDTGLILDSGAWLLGEAAGQLARWIALRPASAPPLHISVNVSVRQLRDGAIVDVVRGALRQSGLPASALWLEVTESCMMDDPESSLATLHELHALGVTLCIDDFGTGYSSLSYLRRFPATIVKIDRAFVSGIGQNSADEAIVKTVIAMAHALDRQVVAEGIETELQGGWLRALGCNLGQGWLFGRPLPATAQRAWNEYALNTPAVPDRAAAPDPVAAGSTVLP
ncbi:MAG: hypothetical protein JWO79_2690 [Actinomycetia bacterium]|nr:hypothetical protein [Actinomycetes bacterium]